MHEREHSSLAHSISESKIFFALNIGKCHLKKNREKKSIFTFHYFEEKKINLNHVDIYVIYVKKFLTKIDI